MFAALVPFYLAASPAPVARGPGFSTHVVRGAARSRSLLTRTRRHDHPNPGDPMRSLIPATLLALALSPALAAAAAPTGWFLAGMDPANYKSERDASVMHDGKASGMLASTGPSKP